MDIKSKGIDVTQSKGIDGKQGFNPTENAGIMPNAKEPSGEREVNKQEQHKTPSASYPAVGSGYSS